MVPKIFVVASIISVISLTNASSVSFITPCKSNDPECARTNSVGAIPKFAAGLPEYGVETMDPISFDSIDASSPHLKFILNDLVMVGLGGCKPNKVQRDTSKSNIFLQLECDLKLDGKYELDGKILLLNIHGKGKIHVLLRNMILDTVLDIEEKEGEDGVKHFKILKHTHSYSLKDKSDLVFEGLLEDNLVLQKAAVELMKTHSNEVVMEIGDKVFAVAIAKITENLNHFFAKVPARDLSID